MCTWKRARLCITLALITMTSVACGPPTDPADGGLPDGAGDAGPDAGPGDGPVFVTSPHLLRAEARALVIAWQTDRPTRAEVAYRVAGGTGSGTASDLVASREFRVEGLPPGRSVFLQISVFDAQGLGAGAILETRTGLLGSPPWRVLFDAAHGQRAGNADWIVDTSGRNPAPAAPGAEDDWDGAYSAFGVDLTRSGRFEVEVLTAGNTFGQGGVGLAGFDVVVIPEPNSRLGRSEIDALDAFVRGGGGLLLIGNHGGSDRDNDGWDSVRVLNEALLGAGWGASLVGDRLSGTARVTAGDGLADGPFGPAADLGAFSGSSVRLEAGTDADLRAVASIPGRATLVVSGRVGRGRLVLHGDSSAADDGTDSGGNTNIFNAWSDPDQQNGAFFLNLVSYLAGEF